MLWIFSTKRTWCKTIAIAQDSMWNYCHCTKLNVKLLKLNKTQCKTIAIAQNSMWNCCHLPILVCWTYSSSCSCFFTFYKAIPFQFSSMWCPSPALQNHQTKVNSYICCMSGSGWNVTTPFINLPPVEKDNSINCVHGYLSTDPPLPTLLSAPRIFCHIFVSSMNNEI